jgi:hypothetical protein
LYAEYTVFFLDENGDRVFENDTNLLAITEDRVFSFTNERYIAPPTGVKLGDAGRILILVGTISVPAMITLTVGAVYRRRKGADNEGDHMEDTID